MCTLPHTRCPTAMVTDTFNKRSEFREFRLGRKFLVKPASHLGRFMVTNGFFHSEEHPEKMLKPKHGLTLNALIYACILTYSLEQYIPFFYSSSPTIGFLLLLVLLFFNVPSSISSVPFSFRVNLVSE
jgi:hypothetical protein